MINFLLRLFHLTNRRCLATFHFKSGKSTSIWCENITVEHNGNVLKSYSIKGVSTKNEDPLFWISLEQVELITLKRY